MLDYDRDGWSDIALVNTSAPLLNLFRNQIGKRSSPQEKGRVVALRFVGGNRSARPSRRFGNRDGYGARVILDLGDMTLTREHRAGDGFSIQNSTTLLVGIGARESVAALTVRWPSGVVQVLKHVAAGKLVTVYEDPAQAPGHEAFAQEPYLRRTPEDGGHRHLAAAEGVERLSLSAATTTEKNATRVSRGVPALRMYTTTATWCAACKQSLPQLQTVRDAFSPEILEMYGVPVDPEDSAEKLTAYSKKHKPAYEILTHLTESDIGAVLDLVVGALDAEVLPSSIITDARGRVLYTDAGVPTISELRRLAGSK